MNGSMGLRKYRDKVKQLQDRLARGEITEDTYYQICAVAFVKHSPDMEPTECEAIRTVPLKAREKVVAALLEGPN